MMTPFHALAEHGQSLWLDFIRRRHTRTGELARLVREGGLRGVTSNPAIFQQALGAGDDYHDALAQAAARPDVQTKTLYEQLAIVDIREAADTLRPVYDSSEALDGYVSLEVAPSLAHDAEGTVLEARRLWHAVDRSNLMIKVPATVAGLQAIEILIAEGINVNVTLIFACSTYEAVADAYMRGLERRLAHGGDISKVASVASFFVSRIDTEVDQRLSALQDKLDDPAAQATLEGLKGRIAIANAKVAYATFKALYADARWSPLSQAGARPQRLLWASTGTKNPKYSDVLYVDGLIGRDTVNTVPPATMEAFGDHGRVRTTLSENLDAARQQLETLQRVGIALEEVTDLLLERGIELFCTAMDGLMIELGKQQRKAQGRRLNPIRHNLSGELADALQQALDAWDEQQGSKRLWNKDSSLWSGRDEDRWMGWLDIVSIQRSTPAMFEEFAQDVRARNYSDIVLLGMGGSSLCPDVLAKTFGPSLPKGAPTLRIVDSTVAAQIRDVHDAVDLRRTLVIVASKSGSTLEPSTFADFFWDRCQKAVPESAGKNFIAITDPGSKLEAQARQHKYWRTFLGVPEIGGRFSAFSHFGMIPAAAMGLDVASFLDEANVMVKNCGPDVAVRDNGGVMLGMLMGVGAAAGRDKLTIVASPAIGSFGAWLEQLIAESTGKDGHAIIPVDNERLAGPQAYEDDRLFVYVRLGAAPDTSQDRAVEALERAGLPVIRIDVWDPEALAQEFFRFEFATAVAASLMGINPFDQPDVEASKIATKKVMTIYEETKVLPRPQSPPSAQGFAFYVGEQSQTTVDTLGNLDRHLERLCAWPQKGDYIALLAYLNMTREHGHMLQQIRNVLGERTRCATTLGFGPRFLHSTGQAHKGGPNSGVFLQFTADEPNDLDIPGRSYSFGVVQMAQAMGDFAVLSERDRRALGIQLGSDTIPSLRMFLQDLERCLSRTR